MISGEHDKRSMNVEFNFSNMHGMLREINDAAALNITHDIRS